MALETRLLSVMLFAAVLLGPISGFSQEQQPDTREIILQDFAAAWTVISESYVDETFGGNDWEALGQEYREKVAAAEDPDTAYLLIAEMIAKLGNENTFIVPPWMRPLEDDEPQFDLEYAGVGILLQELESGDVMVLQVFREAPAEGAGVLVGDLIVGVNEWRVAGEDRISQITDRVRGPIGTPVELTLQDPDGGERQVAITRAKIDLRPSVEYHTVDGTIGYLRIPILNEELVEEGSKALPSLLSTSGLILDLRSVNGGSLEAMVRIAQWFLGAGNLGGFVSRGEAYGLPYRTDAIAAYQRSLVVLTDPQTYGVAEILAFVLREYRRAQFVGNQSSGGFEVGSPVDLPSGALLHVAVGRYLSPRGQLLPQEGIVPDVEVEFPELTTIRAGRDVYVEEAVQAIRNPQRR